MLRNNNNSYINAASSELARARLSFNMLVLLLLLLLLLVCATVCGSAALSGSASGSLWQCARQCARSARGSIVANFEWVYSLIM
jgi:hypothetical protein